MIWNLKSVGKQAIKQKLQNERGAFMAKGIWKKYQSTRSSLTRLVAKQLTMFQKTDCDVQ